MSIVMIDTHIAVALYKGRLDVSRRAQRLLDTEVVRYSPMVALELELLHEIGRAQVPAERVQAFLDEIGIVESKEPLAAVVRQALTLRFTRDPFDRLIVAHAELLRAALVTRDSTLQAHYAGALG
jgi:PIN domain nuclease of toxin-antitoxin system